MEQSALIEAFVLALSDPRVTAALNQTIDPITVYKSVYIYSIELVLWGLLTGTWSQ